jgi:bzd-type benzoyl-CoA reductase N subunit
MSSAIDTSGLSRLEKYYREYGKRAEELTGQGYRFMGYLCAFVPVEIVYAAGFVPFRIKGDVNEPITKADVNMETLICPLVRSCFDLAVKGNYTFLEGLIIPHACDSICKTYDIWKYTMGLPYSHFINMPHKTDDSSVAFFSSELGTFLKSLGKYAGHEITNDDLLRAIELCNANRAKMRRLMDYRKSSPPKITGTQLTELYVANMSIPVEESNELLDRVIAEVEKQPESNKEGKRLLVFGAQVDDASFIKLIEESGAYVVADDLCPGAREYRADVDTEGDLVRNLAERYLRGIKCGRTYEEVTGTYEESIEHRFGHIGKAIKEYGVEGVVLYLYKYCDPYGFEVPALKSYLSTLDVPVLYLEDEYTLSSIGRLKTRIQAFLEVIESQ